MGKIKNYCKKKKISLDDFAEITGIAISTVYYIERNANHQVKNDTMKRIMHATNNKFGEPLMPWDYLDGWIRF